MPMKLSMQDVPTGPMPVKVTARKSEAINEGVSAPKVGKGNPIGEITSRSGGKNGGTIS